MAPFVGRRCAALRALAVACLLANGACTATAPPAATGARPTAEECDARPCYCSSSADCPAGMSCNEVTIPGSPPVCGPRDDGVLPR